MTYDVLVIGGGIAGVSAAAHLAPHGSVLLAERETRTGLICATPNRCFPS